MSKKISNTIKGRSKIPHKPGVYNLKDRKGNTVYTGMTKDLHRRIMEHHHDPSKHFQTFTYRETNSRKEANKIENRRLANKKPRDNKTRK